MRFYLLSKSMVRLQHSCTRKNSKVELECDVEPLRWLLLGPACKKRNLQIHCLRRYTVQTKKAFNRSRLIICIVCKGQIRINKVLVPSKYSSNAPLCSKAAKQRYR